MSWSVGNNSAFSSGGGAPLSNERAYSMGPGAYSGGGNFASLPAGSATSFNPGSGYGENQVPNPYSPSGYSYDVTTPPPAPPPFDFGNAISQFLGLDGQMLQAPSGSDPGFLRALPFGIGTLLSLGSALAPYGNVDWEPGNPNPARIERDSPELQQYAQALQAASQQTGVAPDDFLSQVKNYGNFQTELEQARTGQKQAFGDAAKARGYGYEDFAQYLDPVLSRQEQSIMDALDQYKTGEGRLDTSFDPYKFAFGQYFDPASGAATLGAEEQSQRNQFLQAINAFAPTGFETSRLPETFDDPHINDILGSQYGAAMNTLERARDRGQVTPQGFQGGLNQLGTQRTQGEATLQGIGSNLLASGRNELGNVANSGRTGASSFQLGSTFDPNIYATQLEDVYNQFAGTLPGKLSSQAGQLINFEPAYQAAGQAQGAQNPGGAVAAALSAQGAQRNKNQDRGLGSEGPF